MWFKEKITANESSQIIKRHVFLSFPKRMNRTRSLVHYCIFVYLAILQYILQLDFIAFTDATLVFQISLSFMINLIFHNYCFVGAH